MEGEEREQCVREGVDEMGRAMSSWCSYIVSSCDGERPTPKECWDTVSLMYSSTSLLLVFLPRSFFG